MYLGSIVFTFQVTSTYPCNNSLDNKTWKFRAVKILLQVIFSLLPTVLLLYSWMFVISRKFSDSIKRWRLNQHNIFNSSTIMCSSIVSFRRAGFNLCCWFSLLTYLLSWPFLPKLVLIGLTNNLPPPLSVSSSLASCSLSL